MLKKSLFFEEFSYITSFTANRYSQQDPLWLFDLSIWGQIHNVAGRELITGWPSAQGGGDSEEIADICVWPENGLLVDTETTSVMQSQPQMRCGRCSGIAGFKFNKFSTNLFTWSSWENFSSFRAFCREQKNGNHLRLVWFVGFYSVSTFVGYLMPNPLLCK